MATYGKLIQCLGFPFVFPLCIVGVLEMAVLRFVFIVGGNALGFHSPPLHWGAPRLSDQRVTY